MIVDIQPFQVVHTGTKIDVTVPEFQLGGTETNAMYDILMDSGVVVQRGVVRIPPEVYSTWGTDDMVIVRYVMSQLNIIAA